MKLIRHSTSAWPFWRCRDLVLPVRYGWAVTWAVIALSAAAGALATWWGGML